MIFLKDTLTKKGRIGGGGGGKRKKGEREEVGEQGETGPGKEVHLCSLSVWGVEVGGV